MRRARGRSFFGEWFAGLLAMALAGTCFSAQGQELKLRYRTASVHGFVALHLGEAALVEPKWTAAAWLLFAASIAAMLRRPV